MEFIVIDTEGSPTLSEIAVLDAQGQLIYEAFVAGHPRNSGLHLHQKPLETILTEFSAIARQKRIIAHYAEHDEDILKASYRAAKMPWQPWQWACTCELAQKIITHAPSHSLEFLSKHLNLKVSQKRFNATQAHTARYDAEFTYQLYLHLLDLRQRRTMQAQHTPVHNPFSNSRVDNPFQSHLDFQAIYKAEFNYLAAILGEIKSDPNHQSKGSVVIGVAGSGKTHLMMRLAKEFLKTNRLLFIRQPNNSEAVLHHIYSRILESFAEKVEGTQHTQLELLVANSFIQILGDSERVMNTQKGQALVQSLQQDPLSLYNRMGTEKTPRYRDNWQYIERHINEWWTNQYSAAGYSATILKGIIKFCTYTDPHKKDRVRRWLAGSELEPEEIEDIGLENWREDFSREDFALEAIAVFGRLSLLDEPLMIVFDQLEGLGLEHNRPILESFGEAVKELLTHVPNSLMILNLFPDRWQQFQEYFNPAVVDRISQHQIHLNCPASEQLQQILNLKTEAVGLSLDRLLTPPELQDVLHQPSIRAVLNRAADYFRYKVNNIPLPNSEPLSVSSSGLEVRVQQLEAVLRQIAALVTPYFTAPVTPNALPREDTTASAQTNSEIPSEFALEPALAMIPPDYNGSGILPEPSVEEKVDEYLADKRSLLEQEYHKPTIISDTDDIGKLLTIIEALKTCLPLQLDQLRFGKSKLPEHLLIETPQKKVAIAFLQVAGGAFPPRIKNWNQLVMSRPNIEFYLLRDERESKITGAVSKAEIEKLNHTPNGQFKLLAQRERIHFELMYKLVTDIQERDLEVDLAAAMPIVLERLKEEWLVQLLQ